MDAITFFPTFSCISGGLRAEFSVLQCAKDFKLISLFPKAEIIHIEDYLVPGVSKDWGMVS